MNARENVNDFNIQIWIYLGSHITHIPTIAFLTHVPFLSLRERGMENSAYRSLQEHSDHVIACKLILTFFPLIPIGPGPPLSPFMPLGPVGPLSPCENNDVMFSHSREENMKHFYQMYVPLFLVLQLGRHLPSDLCPQVFHLLHQGHLHL